MTTAVQEAVSDGKLISRLQLAIAALTAETLHVIDVNSCTHDVIMTAERLQTFCTFGGV